MAMKQTFPVSSFPPKFSFFPHVFVIFRMIYVPAYLFHEASRIIVTMEWTPLDASKIFHKKVMTFIFSVYAKP
jgi:hypothetical protein